LAAIYAKTVERNIGRPLRKNTLLEVLYNFRIQSSVGFYSNFWSFSLSNRATLKQFRRQNATSRAPRALARRACVVPSSVFGPPVPSEVARLPKVPTHRSILKSARHAPGRRSRRTDRPRTAPSPGPTAAPLCAHLLRSPLYHGRNLRRSLRHEAHESRLFKRSPPLAHVHVVAAPPLEPPVEQHPQASTACAHR
jgi:hypothetical protein